MSPTEQIRRVLASIDALQDTGPEWIREQLSLQRQRLADRLDHITDGEIHNPPELCAAYFFLRVLRRVVSGEARTQAVQAMRTIRALHPVLSRGQLKIFNPQIEFELSHSKTGPDKKVGSGSIIPFDLSRRRRSVHLGGSTREEQRELSSPEVDSLYDLWKKSPPRSLWINGEERQFALVRGGPQQGDKPIDKFVRGVIDFKSGYALPSSVVGANMFMGIDMAFVSANSVPSDLIMTVGLHELLELGFINEGKDEEAHALACLISLQYMVDQKPDLMAFFIEWVTKNQAGFFGGVDDFFRERVDQKTDWEEIGRDYLKALKERFPDQPAYAVALTPDDLEPPKRVKSSGINRGPLDLPFYLDEEPPKRPSPTRSKRIGGYTQANILTRNGRSSHRMAGRPLFVYLSRV